MSNIISVLFNCTAPCQAWYPDEIKGTNEKVCREFGSCYRLTDRLLKSGKASCKGEICIPFADLPGTFHMPLR